MKRKAGFYWVYIKDRWVVAEFNGYLWNFQGIEYTVEELKFVDEDRLCDPKEQDIY